MTLYHQNIGQDDARTPVTLDNYYAICGGDQKLSALISVVKSKIPGKFMVFMSTCAAVEYFSLLFKE